MTFNPIISWQIDGETVKTVADFHFGHSKITADFVWSCEIKRCLLLERKAMTNIDSILKSRDITLPTKVHLVKAMVFLVFKYGCESWTIKKAEHQQIDAFELWCWRRLLRVPWTARRSNQSILKEISSRCSLEGLMLKLKLQYFGHLMWRTDSFEKTLMLGKIKGRRRRGWQKMRWLMSSLTQRTWVWVDSRSWCWTGRPGMLQFMGSQRVGHDWATELTDWPMEYKLIIYKLNININTVTVENIMGAPQKKCKIELSYDTVFPIPGIHLKKTKTPTSKYICNPMFICSTLYNSEDMKIT